MTLVGWGWTVAALGSVLVLVGIGAHRYHDRRFDAHIRRLEAFHSDEGRIPEHNRGRVQNVTERFHTDARTTWAIRFMILREVGLVLQITGMVAVLGGHAWP